MKSGPEFEARDVTVPPHWTRALEGSLKGKGSEVRKWIVVLGISYKYERSLRRLPPSLLPQFLSAMSSPAPYESDPELARLSRELEERRRAKAAEKKAAAEAEAKRRAEEEAERVRKAAEEAEAAKKSAETATARKRRREEESESEVEEVEPEWVAAR